jgi:hypothetical protein
MKRRFAPLVAERLLCLQMNTDGQVQKCIFEVLHRETTNVVVVREHIQWHRKRYPCFSGYGDRFPRRGGYEARLQLARLWVE